MNLCYLHIPHFTTHRGIVLKEVELSYELAGQPLGSAPIVLVCHALTGNSTVTGADGWWESMIGEDKAIDTNQYTILSFNIPGNCYDGRILYDIDTFNLKDVAKLFIEGLRELSISKLEIVIGASLGGALVWQIGALIPEQCHHIIPIASHYRANDWLLAQTEVQRLLLEGVTPLEYARIHGMLCYRTPQSIDKRFGGERLTNDTPKVLDWLHYHGRVLAERFQLHAYRVMTYLTSTIDAADSVENLLHLRDKVRIISIDSDLLFPHYLAEETSKALGVPLYTIYSEHGHDAFLIEYEQLSQIIIKILYKNTEYDKSKHNPIFAPCKA